VTEEIRALKDAMRTIPDFPVKGILFRDVTPILHAPALLKRACDALTDFARSCGADIIVGIDARGFLFGTPVALALGLPFVPVRKKGKLPW